MRPYRLIGKTTQNRIADCILESIIEWQKEWSVDISQSGVSALDADMSLPKSNGIGIKKDNDYHVFYFDEKVDWKKIVFGHKANACPNDDIATATIYDARHSFARHIYERLVNVQTSYDVKPDLPEIQSSAGDGHLCVQVSVGEENFTIWISNTVVNAFLPAPFRHKASKLVKRSEACEGALASVKVRLDLGSFPVTLLQNLSVGDVLSTDVRLGTPMQLEINKAVSFPVHLGQRDDLKAVLFLPNE